MVIVTPSFAPDFIAFERLHASVLQFTDESVRHLAIVPDRDVKKFSTLASQRLQVVSENDVLPRRLLLTSALARIPKLPRGFRVSAINMRRPWPPIRGWILQQLLKFSVVSKLDEDLALLIDSDVQLVRQVQATTFRTADGTVRVFRQPQGIVDGMDRHQVWQRTAVRLLGVDPETDSPDYISSFTSWNPSLVRECLGKIADVNGREWFDCLSGELDFSEFILYGTYVMCLAETRHRTFVSNRSLCHSYWETTPLLEANVPEFLAGIEPTDVAVLIQSNSGTSEHVLKLVNDQLRNL